MFYFSPIAFSRIWLVLRYSWYKPNISCCLTLKAVHQHNQSGAFIVEQPQNMQCICHSCGGVLSAVLFFNKNWCKQQDMDVFCNVEFYILQGRIVQAETATGESCGQQALQKFVQTSKPPTSHQNKQKPFILPFTSWFKYPNPVENSI